MDGIFYWISFCVGGLRARNCTSINIYYYLSEPLLLPRLAITQLSEMTCSAGKICAAAEGETVKCLQKWVLRCDLLGRTIRTTFGFGCIVMIGVNGWFMRHINLKYERSWRQILQID